MDQWSITGMKAGFGKCERILKDADQIEAIAFLAATASLLDSQFGGERSFTEPSGRKSFRISFGYRDSRANGSRNRAVNVGILNDLCPLAPAGVFSTMFAHDL
jgi:hypothetical protein